MKNGVCIIVQYCYNCSVKSTRVIVSNPAGKGVCMVCKSPVPAERYDVLMFQHEDWEKQTRQLMNFIRTKAEPHIFFRPKVINSKAERLLQNTETQLEGWFSSS